MRWLVRQGDILDEPADVLICSANVWLNLSGGVGGALLLRYGPQLQRELHDLLAKRNVKFLEPGNVVQTSAIGVPYAAILHAVAVDAVYKSSPQLVQTVVDRALQISANLGVQRVALAALATGFGRLPLAKFAEGIRPLMGREYVRLQQVVVCVRHADQQDDLVRALSGCASG